MKCPYCNDKLEGGGFCYTCEEITVDIDCTMPYRDDEEFDMRDTMAHNLHTNEFQNEANK